MDTFEQIEVGDLVIRRGKFSADVRFVEWIDGFEGNINVLLVNGVKDFSYEGVRGIEDFNKEWRLLARAEDLIDEDTLYVKGDIMAKCIKTLYVRDDGVVNSCPSFIKGEIYEWEYDERDDQYYATNAIGSLHLMSGINSDFFKEYFIME